MASIFGRQAPRYVLALAVLAWSGCALPVDGMAPIPQAETAVYTLAPGDQVRIITVGEDALTGQFRVDSDGTVAIPVLGPIKAAGLTATGLAQAISRTMQRVKDYKDPSVSVEVATYRPFSVLGEVNHPGQFPYQPDLTVVGAIALAGGFTYRAIDDRFAITRTVDGRTLEGRADLQTPVQPGDVVTIYERQF